MTASFGLEIAASNKFPGKLWRMVNTCQSGAIGWGLGGQSVVINQTKFQLEYLDPPNSIFKTTNIESFIRQLNLYGFRKLGTTKTSGQWESQIHEFQNEHFIRGRADLLSLLQRNVGMRRRHETISIKRKLDDTSFEYEHSSTYTRYMKSEYFECGEFDNEVSSTTNSPDAEVPAHSLAEFFRPKNHLSGYLNTTPKDRLCKESLSPSSTVETLDLSKSKVTSETTPTDNLEELPDDKIIEDDLPNYDDSKPVLSQMQSPSSTSEDKSLSNMIHTQLPTIGIVSAEVPNVNGENRTVQLPVLLQWDSKLNTYLLRVLPNEQAFNISKPSLIDNFSKDLFCKPSSVVPDSSTCDRRDGGESETAYKGVKEDKLLTAAIEHLNFPLVHGFENIRPGDYYLFGLVPEDEDERPFSPSQKCLLLDDLQMDDSKDMNTPKKRNKMDIYDFESLERPTYIDYEDLDPTIEDFPSSYLKSADTLMIGIDDSIDSFDHPSFHDDTNDVLSSDTSPTAAEVVPDVSDLFISLDNKDF